MTEEQKMIEAWVKKNKPKRYTHGERPEGMEVPNHFKLGTRATKEEQGREPSRERFRERIEMIKKKVMVEVGDLDKLKAAVKVYEDWYPTDNIRTLVELAKRVVAEEEKVLAAIAAPSDYNKY
jgi:hypothetical protein